MRNKFLRLLLLATAGLAFSVGLQAAEKIDKDLNFGPTVVAQAPGAASTAVYMGASNTIKPGAVALTPAEKEYSLTKITPKTDGTVVVKQLAPNKATTGGGATQVCALNALAVNTDDSPFSGAKVTGLALLNNQLPVVTIASDNTVYLVTNTDDGKTILKPTDVAALTQILDATPARVDKPIVAIAAGTSATNLNHIFAAVAGAGKAWKDHDGEARGIAVLNKATDGDVVKGLSQCAPTAVNVFPAAANNKALKINHVANNATFAFGATNADKLLGIKWAATGITNTELTDNVNMYWNNDLDRLYVGLSGVKRDDPAKEGGVCNLLVGDVGKTVADNFSLNPIVKAMTAPRSDVDNAAKKVAIANAACVVAEALANATSAENAKYIAIAARAAAAAGAATLLQAGPDPAGANSGNVEDGLGLGGYVATALASELKNQNVAIADAGAAAGVGYAFAAGWEGKNHFEIRGALAGAVLADLAAPAASVAQTGLALNAIVTPALALNVTDANTLVTFDAAPLPAAVVIAAATMHTIAPVTGFVTAAAGSGAFAINVVKYAFEQIGVAYPNTLAATQAATKEARADLIQVAANAGAAITALAAHANTSGGQAIYAALADNATAIHATITAQGNKSYVASAAAIAGMAAAATVAAHQLGNNAAALAAGTAVGNTVKDVVTKLGVAMAKAINADAVTGADATMAVNAAIDAYRTTTGTTTAKIAAARAAAQTYVDNVQYSDVALAMKKTSAVASLTDSKPENLIAATTAAALVETAAAAMRGGLADDNTKAAEYFKAATAGTNYATVAAAGKDAAALAYLQHARSLTGAKLIAPAAANVYPGIGLIKTAPVYADTAAGFVTAQTLVGARASATALETYVGSAAGILSKPANALIVPVATAVNAVATTAKTSATIATVTPTITPYLTQKVAANDARLMVTNYFAGAGYPKTATLDANDPTTDRARIVNQFNRNGTDDVAITAGKMVSFKTAGTKGKNYLITNVITSAPAQMAGGLFISGSKNLICALPVLSDKKADGTYHGVAATAVSAAPFVGTMAKVANGAANFDYPASTMAEMPRLDDAAVTVGGGKALFGGTWVKDIFTDANNNVYVALGGYKPANEGLWKSTALVDANGIVTGWTPWARVKGLNKRVMAAAYNPVDGTYMFLRAAKDAGVPDTAAAVLSTEFADFYTNINTIEVTGGTTTVEVVDSTKPTALSTVVAGAITPATGGVFNVFSYDEKTPGFAEGQMSMLVSVGFDKITLARTGKWNTGALTPETAFTAGTNVFTMDDAALNTISPLVSTAMVADATGQAWLFAGGSRGLAVYRKTADGAGLKNFTGATYETAAGVTTAFAPAAWSFKKIGDFSNIRKLLAKGNALWVVTDTMIYAIGVAANKFDGAAAAATTAALNASVVMQFEADSMGYISDVLCLENNIVLVATTKGMYVFKFDATINAWIVDAQYNALGPVSQLNYIQKTAGKGDLIVLLANFANKTGELSSYTVDTTKTTLSDVVTTQNKTIALNEFCLNFATDGAVAVVNLPTSGTVKVVQLGKTTAEQVVIDQDFSKGGVPAYDSTSGRFVIPGDEGLVVN